MIRTRYLLKMMFVVGYRITTMAKRVFQLTNFPHPDKKFANLVLLRKKLEKFLQRVKYLAQVQTCDLSSPNKKTLYLAIVFLFVQESFK